MHVDAMSNTSMSEWFQSISPISVAFMSPYFDYLAFLIVIAVGGMTFEFKPFGHVLIEAFAGTRSGRSRSKPLCKRTGFDLERWAYFLYTILSDVHIF